MFVRKNSNPAGVETKDPHLRKLLRGKALMQCKARLRIFSQGEKENTIYFVQSGKVRITVVSAAGKEAVLSIVTPRHFFGEGCLVVNKFRKIGLIDYNGALTVRPDLLSDVVLRD